MQASNSKKKEEEEGGLVSINMSFTEDLALKFAILYTCILTSS